jgi:hypothetical protein
MSTKKRKSDLPEDAAALAGADAMRTTLHPEYEMPVDASDDGAVGGGESDHATMQAQREEFKIKLDAALFEIERLRAAASEPCARCNFYSDWTVRVRATV